MFCEKTENVDKNRERHYWFYTLYISLLLKSRLHLVSSYWSAKSSSDNDFHNVDNKWSGVLNVISYPNHCITKLNLLYGDSLNKGILKKNPKISKLNNQFLGKYTLTNSVTW